MLSNGRSIGDNNLPHPNGPRRCHFLPSSFASLFLLSGLSFEPGGGVPIVRLFVNRGTISSDFGERTGLASRDLLVFMTFGRDTAYPLLYFFHVIMG